MNGRSWPVAATAAALLALAVAALSGCGEDIQWYICEDPALTPACWRGGCPLVDGRSSTASKPYESKSACEAAIGGGPGGDILLTCDARSYEGICIHYTFTSAQDRDDFADQCAYRTANDHSCPSGGVGCRHTTPTRTSDTFVYTQNTALVTKDCTDTNGTPL